MSAPKKKRRSGPSGPSVSHEERVLRDQHRVQFSLSGADLAFLEVIRVELAITKSEVISRALRLYFASLPRD